MLYPIDDHDRFEDLCLELFRQEWKDPTAQRNGTNGQAQNGVDIYGIPEGDALHFGLQCKWRQNWQCGSLTASEIQEEIEKAKRFSLQLGRYAFVTTVKRDEPTQEAIRRLDVKSRAEGLFKIGIFFWEDLQALLEKHISVTGV